MSKWIDRSKYEEFAKKKKEEKEKEPASKKVGGGLFLRWQNPKMGDQENPNVYKVRVLPDKQGNFYVGYFFHFFKSGEKSNYVLCPKTFGFDRYCPWCHATQILYKGNQSDKQRAQTYRRNQRYVANVYIVNDPRDASVQDESYKVGGTVRLYEFPATIENKIKNEITDPEQGYGPAIFDPEEGHDFLIKVRAKKPDKYGNIWPDYSDTMFARKPSAISNDEEEIKKIMESVYDLNEYLENLSMSWENHKKLLQQEMLWEDVKSEFLKYSGMTNGNTVGHSDEVNTTANPEREMDQIPEANNEETETENESNNEDSDEDLLEELKSL